MDMDRMALIILCQMTHPFFELKIHIQPIRWLHLGGIQIVMKREQRTGIGRPIICRFEMK